MSIGFRQFGLDRPSIILIGVTVIGLGTGCGDSLPGAEQWQALDSVGIRIITTARPKWTGSGRHWEVERDPAITIPGSVAGAAYFLDGVTAVVMLADGPIVVGNAGTRELHWFDAAGSYQRSTGGPGEGPGEFRGISDVFRCRGDTLVIDEGQRLSILDARGAFVKVVRTRGELYRTFGTVAGIASDCSAALVVEGAYRPPEAGEGVHQLPHALSWASLNGLSLDTLTVFAGPDLYPWILRGQASSMRLPFGKVPRWTTNGERVAFASAGDFEIQLFDRQGTLKRLVRWRGDRGAVGEEARRRFRQEYDAVVGEGRSSPADDPAIDVFPIPDSMPTIADLRFDDAGNLWARQYLHDERYEREPEAQRWWVFDPMGVWLGSLSTPPAIEVLSIQRGFIVGISRDDADVQSIRFYRLSKVGHSGTFRNRR